MTYQELKQLIDAFRAETQPDSITPDTLGQLLDKIAQFSEDKDPESKIDEGLQDIADALTDALEDINEGKTTAESVIASAKNEALEEITAATADVEEAKEEALEEIEEAIAGIDVTYSTISGDNVQLKNGSSENIMPKSKAEYITYDKSVSQLASTQLQGATDEVALAIQMSDTKRVAVSYSRAGYGVKYDGTLFTSGSSSRTTPIEVLPGEKLCVKYTGNPNNSLLAGLTLSDSAGDNRSAYSLFFSGSLNNVPYSYTNNSEETKYVIVSYTSGLTFSIYKETAKTTGIGKTYYDFNNELNGVKPVKYDWRNGFYRNANGSAASSNNTSFGSTTHIELKAGEVLHLTCGGGNPSYLWKWNGSSYSQIANLGSSKKIDYSSATDVTLMYSGGAITSISITYESELMDSFRDAELRGVLNYPSYTEIVGYNINSSNNKVSNGDWKITSPIPLLKGEGLHYFVQGGGVASCFITNAAGTTFSPVTGIISSGYPAHWEYYEASSDCYVILQNPKNQSFEIAVNSFKSLKSISKQHTDYVLDSLQNNMANPLFETVTSFNTKYGNTPLTQSQIINSESYYHRGPTVCITNNSTYLVAATKMVSMSDDAKQGITLARKAAGGEWSVSDVIDVPTTGYYGNPCFVIDRTGGHGQANRIYLFYFHSGNNSTIISGNASNADCRYKYSDDDGVTWSEEVSLKSGWDSNKYVFLVPAPSAGIQMSNGTLVIPAMGKNFRGWWSSGIIYKTTSGEWTFSCLTPRYGDNECTCYEKGSTLILNCRYDNYAYAQYNSASALIKRNKVYQYSFTADTWTDVHDTFIARTPCESSICKVSNSLYLRTWLDPYKNGDDPNTRERLTLYASSDASHWIRIVRFKDGNRNGTHQASSANTSRGYACVAYYNNKIIVAYEDNDHTIGFVDFSNAMDLINKSVTFIAPMNTETKLQYLIEKVLLNYSYF